MKKNRKEHYRIIRARNFLERNKIFFEIFSSIGLGFMAIIISVVGIVFSYKSTKILDNDREPYFIINCEQTNKKLRGNESDVKKVYTIKNEGGLITGAYLLEVNTQAIITIPEPESGFVTYTIDFIDIFEKTEGIMSLYDEKNKEFKFYSTDNNKFNKIIDQLRKNIIKTYSLEEGIEWNHGANVIVKNVIAMEYVNYKNEDYHQVYQFFDSGKMTLIKETNFNKNTFLGSTNINGDVDDIVNAICEKVQDHELAENQKRNYSDQ